jgi:hypothetical protein
MNAQIILSRGWVTIEGVWIGNRIYWTLKQLVTTNNHNILIDLHTPKFTLNAVLPSRCSVAASNGGRSPSSGFSAASAITFSHLTTATLNCLNKSKSELLYDWRFTANQSWRQTPRDLRWEFLFHLKPCGHSPYVTSLTRKWICLVWIGFTFVKCTYRTYSVLLKILHCALYTSPLSVQALQSRSCLS